MGKGIVAMLILLMLPLAFAGSVDSEVMDALEGKERVKVIVMLKDAPVDTSVDTVGERSEEQQEMISEQQWEVLDAFGSGESSIFSGEPDFILDHKYSSINALSGSVTAEGLETLKAQEEVASIVLEEIYTISLDGSVPQIGVPEVRGVRPGGINLTGINQTVCVIDTGIDYTHANLGNCSTENLTNGACGKVLAGHDFCADDTSCATTDTDPIDVHGHGTHVSGIVASNHSTYTGVAPDARLIALKVCNSSGSCPNSDIIAALDWCVTNKTLFNISVVTMSLGGGLLSSSCDTNAVANASNIAAGAGMFVTAATGNDDATSQIAAPACGSNVTAVGSVTSTDAIASNSNRATFDTIFAPGDSITSLQVGTDGTSSQSGTSMATPHVAGVAALLLQFNSSLTGADIKWILNATGKPITDGSNTYYRVNASAALYHIDSLSPVFSFNGSNATSVKFNYSVLFNMTFNDTVNLNSYTFSWNDSGSWVNASNGTFRGQNQVIKLAKNITATRGDVVGWKFHVNDSGSNKNVTIERIFTVLNTAPVVSGGDLNDSSLLASEDISVNATYTDVDSDVGNVSFFWFRNGTGIYNETFTSIASGTVIYSNLSASNYSVADVINVTINASDATDSSSVLASSQLTVVNLLANATLQRPANSSVLRINNTLLNWTAIDGDNDTMNCYVYGDNTSNPTNRINFTGSIVNGSSVTYNWTDLNESTYYWKVQCDDGVANGSNSSIFQFTIAIPPTTSVSLNSVTDYDSDGNIEINWSDDGNETNEQYRIYRFSSPIFSVNSSVTNITTGVVAGTQFYEDVLTDNGTTYWYAVVTVDDAGNYNDSVVSTSLNGNATDSIRPAMSTLTNVTSSSGVTTLNWTNTTLDIDGNTDNFSLRFKIWNKVTAEANFTALHVNETASLVKTVTYASACKDGYCTTTHDLSDTSSYTYYVTTIDDGNNENVTLQLGGSANAFNMTATKVPSSSSSTSSGGGGGSSGGGSGGGAAKSGFTYDYTDNSDLNAGAATTVSPTQGSGYKFKVAGADHTLTVSKLYEDRVVVVIQSDPISAVFKPGEEKEFDIDEDTVLDLYVKLESITGGTAQITMRKLNLADAPIVVEEEVQDVSETLESFLEEDVPEEIQEENNQFWKSIVGALIALLVLVILLIFRFRPKHHHNHESHSIHHHTTEISEGHALREHFHHKDHHKKR